MPDETPMAKVDATRNYGGRVELTGAAFEESLAASREFAERTGPPCPRLRGSVRDRGPGDDRARARRAGSRARDGRGPDRRRRARRRNRARAERASSSESKSSASRPTLRAVRRLQPARPHDCGGDHGQGARRADAVDPRPAPGRRGDGHGRGDLAGDRPAARTDEARGRGRRRRIGRLRCWPAASKARAQPSRSSRAATSTRRS